MSGRRIQFSKAFLRQLDALSADLQYKVEKASRLFRQNEFHPSLRLHKLSGQMQGYWSISMDRRYRMIFLVVHDGDALFVSVGTHAIYNH